MSENHCTRECFARMHQTKWGNEEKQINLEGENRNDIVPSYSLFINLFYSLNLNKRQIPFYIPINNVQGLSSTL